MAKGRTRNNLCGLVNDAPAPKRITMLAMMMPSCKVPKSRSCVIAPPTLIPAIQSGRGSTGSWTMIVPGIGVPMRTPNKVRTRTMKMPSLKADSKLLDQGALSRAVHTTRYATPTITAASQGLLARATAIAKVMDQIHHVSGCRKLVTKLLLLLRNQRFRCFYFNAAFFSGIGIDSTDHSRSSCANFRSCS